MCGHNDWRMPTKVELQGLLTPSAINRAYFPNTRGDYWSSTKYYTLWWVVNLLNGNVAKGSGGNFTPVRLVRSVQ